MKQKFLLLLIAAAVLFSFGTAYSAQTGGLSNAGGPALPVTDDGVAFSRPLQVHVNPGGLGDFLYSSYFNVRDNNVQYFQLVNTDSTMGYAVKFRIREAATIAGAGCGGTCSTGSLETLDFIVCLSAGDVWTGAITGSGDGPALLWNLDGDTLTSPQIPSNGQPLSTQVTANVSITADQTKEGYYEAIGLQSWDETSGSCSLTSGLGGDVPNVLFMNNYNINDDTARSFEYRSLALADWTVGIAHTIDLGNDVINITNGTDGYTQTTTLWANDFVLTKANMNGTFLTDANLGAETVLSVTFPTKYYNLELAQPLFDDPTVAYAVWDTMENMVTPVAGFSPSFVQTAQLPHEVNLVNIWNSQNSYDTVLFTSDVEGRIEASDIPNGDYLMGWVNIDMTPGAVDPANCLNSLFISCTRAGTGLGVGDEVDSAGLPAIGLVFQTMLDEDVSAAVYMNYDHTITDN